MERTTEHLRNILLCIAALLASGVKKKDLNMGIILDLYIKCGKTLKRMLVWKNRLFQISEKTVLRLLSGVSAEHSIFKWQFLKINLQLIQICHRASEMLCCCSRSCCWHKPVTVICSAHKLALHISSVCGSAGYAQLPSSTQLDEVAHTANHGGDPHKDTILLGLQGICTAVRGRICVRDKMCMKNTQQMEKTCWYTHLVVMIKWRLQCSTPQLAENEGSTKISSIDAYLMEALGTC